MFVDKVTRKRVNPFAQYVDAQGATHLRVPADLLDEIPDPTPPADYSEDTYYRTEQDDAPYVVYTKKSPEQLAAIRWQKLKQIRDELTEEGGCLVQGKWFHSDVKSKQQQLALHVAGANLPEMLLWKTMDGSFINMTQALAAELFAAQIARESTIFAICELKRSDDTPVNDGWPDRYVPQEAQQ